MKSARSWTTHDFTQKLPRQSRERPRNRKTHAQITHHAGTDRIELQGDAAQNGQPVHSRKQTNIKREERSTKEIKKKQETDTTDTHFRHNTRSERGGERGTSVGQEQIIFCTKKLNNK